MRSYKGKLALRRLYAFESYILYGISLFNEMVEIILNKKRRTGTCPMCNKKRRKVIEIRPRTIRDLDLRRNKCYLKINIYRIKCTCGYRGMEKIEFVKKGERYTTDFADYVFSLCEKMCLSDVAKTTRIHWETAKRIDKEKLKEKFKDLKEVNPTKIGVDEIAHEKGHKYLTIVRDLDAGVIWVGEKRKKETLDKFFKELGKEKCEKITVAVIDMWDPYIKSIKENTNAKIVFDRFHISKKINEVVDEIRKKEFSKADEKERIMMKHKRFLILARQERLNNDEKETLQDLLKLNKNLYIAYILKEHVLDIFDETNKNIAIERLERWIKNVYKAEMLQFEDVIKMMKTYWYGINNYFEFRITNAASEGYNNKINIIKRRAYGFRDIEYLKLKILQICS